MKSCRHIDLTTLGRWSIQASSLRVSWALCCAIVGDVISRKIWLRGQLFYLIFNLSSKSTHHSPSTHADHSPSVAFVVALCLVAYLWSHLIDAAAPPNLLVQTPTLCRTNPFSHCVHCGLAFSDFWISSTCAHRPSRPVPYISCPAGLIFPTP